MKFLIFGMLIIISVVMLTTGMVSAAEAAETAKNASNNGLKYIFFDENRLTIERADD